MKGLGLALQVSAEIVMALVRWSMLEKLPRRRRCSVSSRNRVFDEV